MSRLDRPVARFRALLLALALAAAWARADELQDIDKLVRQGQHEQALERVNRYLAQKPRDAQGRFLKGLILAEENKVSEAIEVFKKLSQDYPQLPEPYNNLAVLYAAQGQYEKAREELEASIRTHPSYATAYENLGDVYTKLASDSYDKAFQLDSSNSGAKTKLSLIHELISSTNRLPRPATSPSSPTAEPSPQSLATASERADTEAKQPSRPAKAETAKTDAAVQPRSAPDQSKDDVLRTLADWANTWSKQDSSGYLAFYAKDFRTPNGETRADWEAARTRRISAPKRIEVIVRSPTVKFMGDNNAVVTFRQLYRSDHLKANAAKTLVMIRSDGRWLIQEERTGS